MMTFAGKCFRITAAIACLGLLVGCGGGDSADQGPPITVANSGNTSTPAEDSAAENTASTGETGDSTSSSSPSSSGSAPTISDTGGETVTFKGRVTIDGTRPELAPLIAQGDPKVKDEVCTENAVPDDSVRGEGNGLADVFIYVRKLPDDVDVPPAPTDPVPLDQQGCRFIPQGLFVRVGQTLLLKNSDPVSHNVRTQSFSNPINQIVKPNDQEGIPVTYEREERVPIQTRCDIHTWMSAYHLPVDNPWHAVTAMDGSFEIADLPPGEWEFTVWHGAKGYIEKSFEFEASAGQTVEQNFSVPASDLTK
ncbi:MAG: hypothetical protein DWQ34_11100 [Planctomycetota bacterium]|nr:MAG: hypothetical protein DWQ29_05300 [Planctomycetota bacterium]REJ93263.1 MAG: hypothetical protein DWQ34_11100 [Planctomycetota bacterium]REK22556.1 MAG: hypothetical protein DWQ41_18895 [Planctomycetota bacterium]REK36022.1 MAG: hypothetical protein DWQ45_10060 [Planctomycetota bacterium]